MPKRHAYLDFDLDRERARERLRERDLPIKAQDIAFRG